MATEGLDNRQQRRRFSSSNGSSKTIVGTRFRSRQRKARGKVKARAKVKARGKVPRARTQRARAKIRVFRGGGKSM